VTSIPETDDQRTTDDGEGWSDVHGFQIALVFFGLTVLAAILLAIYVLAWNGGAHT
jgi:hypothetical protein